LLLLCLHFHSTLLGGGGERKWYDHFGKHLGQSQWLRPCHPPGTQGLHLQMWILTREYMSKDVLDHNICHAAQSEITQCLSYRKSTFLYPYWWKYMWWVWG
jgi:hypothetical protein